MLRRQVARPRVRAADRALLVGVKGANIGVISPSAEGWEDGIIPDSQLRALVAYIKTLKTG